MTYEDLKKLSQYIEDALEIKEDIDNLLEFQSKLVDVEESITISFSYEAKSEDQPIKYENDQESAISYFLGMTATLTHVPSNSINMAYTELDSRSCIRLISELIKYNENKVDNLLKQINDERTADTVEEDKTA
jgi:hypothetical protein